MLNPAQRVIEICGGFRAVAEMTGRHETRVRRWTYDKDKGGTGGVIPADMQQRILDAARARRLPLEPEHFFVMPEEGGASDGGCETCPEAATPGGGAKGNEVAHG